MKMVKSLLLGSAATLIAVAGAQAADLPVKAKAVEYVKVCSLYGAGFYYIPGTDTCIKIGGYVRADFDYNGVPTLNPHITGQNGRFTRSDTADTSTRARFVSSWDVRTQTEYGTLRSFVRAGWQSTSQGATTSATLNGTDDDAVYIDRAMIQFAGFTFGLAQSFFDFSAPHGNGTYGFFSDTGGSGTRVVAYTAQFGNGLSLTLSMEDPSIRRRPLIDLSVATWDAVGGAATSNYIGANIPDFVANLRLDQAWGSAQISGAIHQVAAGYYGAADNVNTPVGVGTTPGDEWGYAIRGGLSFNLPTGPGDQLILEGAYGKGATHYVGNNYSSVGMFGSGTGVSPFGTLGLGYFSDGVFTTPGTAIAAALGGGTAGGGIELTEAWSAYGSFQHFWTPALRTSIYGGVVAIDYSDTANRLMCSSVVGDFSNPAGCNYDFKVYQVGSRTIWSPVQNLDLSIDVFYTKLDQSHSGTTYTIPAAGAKSAGAYEAADQDVWSAMFRAQRNFWF